MSCFHYIVAPNPVIVDVNLIKHIQCRSEGLRIVYEDNSVLDVDIPDENELTQALEDLQEVLET